MALRTHLTLHDINIAERAILELTDKYEATYGEAPTQETITELLGYKPRSLRVSYRRLVRDGYLIKRDTTTLSNGREVRCPVTYRVRDPHGVGE